MIYMYYINLNNAGSNGHSNLYPQHQWLVTVFFLLSFWNNKRKIIIIMATIKPLLYTINIHLDERERALSTDGRPLTKTDYNGMCSPHTCILYSVREAEPVPSGTTTKYYSHYLHWLIANITMTTTMSGT